MRRHHILALAMAAFVAGPAFASDAVARGDYIVNRLSRCNSCHTPREPGAAPLSGAKLAFMPVDPAMAHADFAPAIAGLPAGRNGADVTTLLETGAYPGGTRPRPPMPPFRMTHDDAQAVTAYLASLKP